MVLLLGASGYLGSSFAAELRRRGHLFIPLTRTAFDYTRFDYLFDYLRTMRPVFLINAAGYSCRADQDGTEISREKAMVANAMFPQMIARACLMTRTPWGHVSSGSIYTGAKAVEAGQRRLVTDLGNPDILRMFESDSKQFEGFNELEEPNFSFRSLPCNFYSGAKALAEEAIRDIGQCYIWRPRLAFCERDTPSNFLWQFQRQARRTGAIESLSHVEDCIRACLDLWERQAPFGIYNVTNPGAISTRQLEEMIARIWKMPCPAAGAVGSEEAPRAGGQAPQSHCILDVSKLQSAGVKIRGVEEALEDALEKSKPADRVARARPGASTAPLRPAAGGAN